MKICPHCSKPVSYDPSSSTPQWRCVYHGPVQPVTAGYMQGPKVNWK